MKNTLACRLMDVCWFVHMLTQLVDYKGNFKACEGKVLQSPNSATVKKSVMKRIIAIAWPN